MIKQINLNRFSALIMILFILGATGCTPKKAQAPTQATLLLGTWILQKVVTGEQEFPANMMGGEISFRFIANNTVELKSPQGRGETAKYTLTDGIIKIDDGEVDPESDEAKLTILKLDKEILQLAVILDGQDGEMHLTRKVEE